VTPVDGSRNGPGPDLLIRGARVEPRGELVDIGVGRGVIHSVTRGLPGDAPRVLEAEGRLAVPAFVQPHLHLDKVCTAPLLSSNRTGTLPEAISLLQAIKSKATIEEVAQRAGAVIRLAVLSGSTFIRSHVDVDTIGGLVPLRGVLRAAREHEDLCDVAVVAFPQEGIVRDPGTAELMDAAMQHGASVVGGMPHWERSVPDARRHIDICFDLAERYDADVDMHVDETDDPTSRTLELLLDATEDRGWQGRVTASHCCAMAAWEAPLVEKVVRRLAELDVRMVTNPATNLLLQGRGDGLTPRRGLPPVKALLEAGVTIACGQDCVQDAFYPFGSADPLQVALILCHAAQLSTPAEISSALETIGEGAARIVGLDRYGLRPGCAANVVVLDADSIEEALRLQAPRRWVIHAGRVVAENDTRRVLHAPTAQEAP
jgi:cytosine/creatinine deaminase